MPRFERLLQLPPNLRGEDYVIGDIHGHFFLLERLLERIGFDPAYDRLLSVGDLVDRGPDSHRATEFLRQPWFHAVRGNHEKMMLDAVGGPHHDPDARALWEFNGGDWFESLPEAEAAALLDPVARLPYVLILEQTGGGRIGVVHADLPGRDWQRAMVAVSEAADDDPVLDDIVWSRRRAGVIQRRLDGGLPWKSVSPKGIDRLYFGHTPMPAAIACGHTRWLDTGVFLPRGRLSVTAVSDDTLWSLALDEDDCRCDWRILPDR